ncbi:MAG: AarF/ABC1/UbiB kinase family protein [Chrysiogenetes bacterium]|nr:AarF/ABC1/UbiB kinase family protein [Chrysiogenetes bacterium]
MAKDGVRKIPRGRVTRMASLGNMAVGVSNNMALAAGRTLLGGGIDSAAEKFHQQTAKTFAQSLAGMKGLPMKVGQMVSYIDDAIPAGYRHIYTQALSELQVRARPMRWSEIEAVFKKDLGAKPEDIFKKFEREPIAAASIGQVYRAELPDGRVVAVKVQYPGIDEAIRSDLKNLDLLRNAMAMVLPKVDLEQTLDDLTSRVLEECDYGCELCNQQDFADAWEGTPGVVIPRPHTELCRDHILVLDYVSGESWEEMRARGNQEERNEIGRNLFAFLFRSLYVHGMFNADPHPGNYLFPGGADVAYLDFGCVQRYPPAVLADLKGVGSLVREGGRGSELREALARVWEIQDEVDEEEWAFLEEYAVAVYEPAIKDEPFTFNRAYTERLSDLSIKGGFLAARKALRKGIREAKRPGMLYLNRIQFGLASVLASIEAEANWHEVLGEILVEAQS